MSLNNTLVPISELGKLALSQPIDKHRNNTKLDTIWQLET